MLSTIAHRLVDEHPELINALAKYFHVLQMDQLRVISDGEAMRSGTVTFEQRCQGEFDRTTSQAQQEYHRAIFAHRLAEDTRESGAAIYEREKAYVAQRFAAKAAAEKAAAY